MAAAAAVPPPLPPRPGWVRQRSAASSAMDATVQVHRKGQHGRGGGARGAGARRGEARQAAQQAGTLGDAPVAVAASTCALTFLKAGL
eukprot:5275888-Pleurochrysis_carterae.AAC.3